MFGIGNDFQTISLSNCYLLEQPLDSYSSILKIDEQLVSICKRRGGVGIDLDNLRPNGSVTHNAAKTSTGITTWMERYSNSIREVGQSGRRGALMLTLSVHHPDIIEFCTIKNDPTKVTGANISVKLTKEFLDALKNEKYYELRFPVNYKELNIAPKISKTISAKEVWDIITTSAHNRAEPGLLMWDNVIENTPADCYEDFKSKGTNPCSEINLSPLDSCRLLCINLFSYVKNPFTKDAEFDFSLFDQHSQIAQRLMDDLVDLESEKINKIIQKIESDPEPNHVKEDEISTWKKIKYFNDNGRRTGTGITALGDVLAALGIKYGSEESISITEKIYQTLKLSCYRSSVEMSKELGSFINYNAEKEKKCPFIQRIKDEDPSLYKDMVKYGRRNISLITTAPTGSVSCLTQTTSGIEPLFMPFYIRRKKINPNDKNARVDFVDQNGDSWQEFSVYHNKIKLWMDICKQDNWEKSPYYKACAEDINWINRVKMQAAAQKHVCHAISSTINLPEDVSKDVIAKIYETAFDSGCKGITVYRKNCRTGVLIEKKTENKNKIVHTVAPKRPNTLKCDVHHIQMQNKRYYVVVGLLNNDPYEVFVSPNEDDEKDPIIPKTIKDGILVKKAKRKYVLQNSEKEFSCVITNGHSDDNADTVGRLTSASLRHGCPISFIVHQLEKTHGDLSSFSKVLCRVLKKYIPDGTKVSGENCPECSSELVRENGCVSCKSCGHSRCS
jgi:ribonucleoside-diphosphate reductase alpha chain